MTARLLDELVTSAQPRDREVEAAKRKARAALRYGTGLTRRRSRAARALNRATLARQLLLRRHDAAGARRDRAPGRDAGAGPARPVRRALVAARAVPARRARGAARGRARVVRIVVMRATIHLVTRRRLPAAAPADAAGARRRARAPPRVRAAARGVDLTPVLAFARALLAERPRTGPQLRAALAERFPDRDAAGARLRLPLPAARCVQVPPRGVWGATAQVTIDDRRGVARPAAGRAARRSTTSCCATSARSARRRSPTSTTWSRLTGLREVVERLRPRAADVPRRARPRAVRPARRAAARSRHARRRRGSCPSTTTCCSRTPTAAASFRPGRAARLSGAGGIGTRLGPARRLPLRRLAAGAPGRRSSSRTPA